MNIDAVHWPGHTRQFDLAMQHAPAFEGMRRNVLVFPVQYLVAREDGIAMVTGVVDAVLAIGKIGVHMTGQKFMLRLAGPVLEAAGALAVTALHFLQKHNIGTEQPQTIAQFMYRQPAIELRQALVDIVASDGKRTHARIIRSESGAAAVFTKRTRGNPS